jgi:hypothetical protein
MRDLIDIISEASNPLSNQAFRSWFGNSKTVDRDGTPIVFYHGSPRGNHIDAFSASENDGIYFTNDPDYAGNYAVEFRQNEDPMGPFGQYPAPGDPFDWTDQTGAIYPVYLSIKNPLIISEHDEEQRAAYTDRGLDRIKLKAEGYDGIILLYDDGEIEAQIFDPYQAKSVFNQGTFDSRSHHISEDLNEEIITISPEPKDDEVFANRMQKHFQAWRPTDLKKIGEINGLEIMSLWPISWHNHIFFTQHKQPVGYATLLKAPTGGENSVGVSIIWLPKEERHKGFGLAFYKLLLDLGLTIVADRHQTKSVQVIWQRLALSPGITVTDENGERIARKDS